MSKIKLFYELRKHTNGKFDVVQTVADGVADSKNLLFKFR